MAKRIFSLLTFGPMLCGLAGTAAAQTSPSPYTSAVRYDALGRVVGTISPDPDSTGALKFLATRTTYDAAGRAIKMEKGELASWFSELTAPASWTGFAVHTTVETTYNAQGAKLTERVKGTNGVTVSLTQYSYDPVGRLECTAVRMNPTVYGSLPASACSLSTLGSEGPDRITRNIYDIAGQVVQVRNGVGTTLERAEVTYTYTNNGKIKYVIDAVGNKAEKRYDGFDRQIRWVFPSAMKPTTFDSSTAANAVATAGALNEADYEQYGYDANSNRTSFRTRRDEALTYTYDFLNRMSVKTVPERSGLAATHTRDVYYSYDLQGRQTSARFDGTSGEGVISQYDGFGRQTYSLQNLDGAHWSLGYWYDANGNREQMNFPDSVWVTYAYDGLNRPTTVNPYGAGSFGYMYNARGELYHAWRGPTAVQFEYDAASRMNSLNVNIAGTADDNLISLSARNPASQITVRTNGNDFYAFTSNVNATRNYTTNGLNQYSNVAGTGYTYDANGNLTFDGTHTFVYDVENRLVSRTSAASSTTLRYDPLGRLYEVSDSVLGLVRFHYDGDAMVSEYNASLQLVNRYVHGPIAGMDDPMVWFPNGTAANWNLRYLYGDERGSIVAVADSNGNKVRINAYDEYGVPGANNLGRFQYTGQVWLPELGMHYYKARMYSPTLGRFMQVDPIGYDDQFNLYAYVGNDPLNAVDPSGKRCVIANMGSEYCRRRQLYRSYDRVVSSQTRFFAAAARTVEYLANHDLPIIGNVISDRAEEFLRDVSSRLETVNRNAFQSIRSGFMTGPNLDRRLVHSEQNRVQEALNSLPEGERNGIVSSINAAFSNTILRYAGGFLSGSDRAYGRILSKVEKELGVPIDFGNQEHREAIGLALVKYAKATTTTTCTGSIIKRC